MESLISDTKSIPRTGRPEISSTLSPTSKMSLRIHESFDGVKKKIPDREEIETGTRKESRSSTRCQRKESLHEMHWNNDANEESEEDDKTGSKRRKNDEIRHNEDLTDAQMNNIEERNNNINIRQAIHQDQSSLIIEDGIKLPKSTKKKDSKENIQMDTNSPPISLLQSPFEANPSPSVVDAVAGTSASVAVNSFLKFSIQNILQVRHNCLI